MYNNNKKVKTMTKNTTEENGFFSEYEDKVQVNIRIGKVTTAMQLWKRKSSEEIAF